VGRRPFTGADLAWLAVICAIAFLVRVVVAARLSNQLWPDEIFQSIEQAHRLVFGYGIVPLEFRVGARPWLLPGALAGIVKLTAPLGAGSSGYLRGVEAALSLVSLAPVAIAYRWAQRESGRLAGVVAAFFCAGWFELIYFAPKALPEVVGAHLLIVGLYLGEPHRRRLGVLVAGALLGLAGALRLELVPALLVPAWRLRRDRAWLYLVLAALATFALAQLADLVGGFPPFHSLVEGVRLDWITGRRLHDGASPWAYPPMILEVWAWTAPVVIGLALLGDRVARPALVCAVLLFLVQSAIPHKEYRFLFPSLALVVVAASVGAGRLLSRVSGPRQVPCAVAAVLAWLALSGQRATVFSSADIEMGPGLVPPSWEFDRLRGGLTALDELSREPQVCGVGLVGVRWYNTGGYSHLHKRVALYELYPDELKQAASRVDAALAWQGRELAAPYQKTGCWGSICLWQRPGGCTVDPSYDINDRLRVAGE
jgi:hypothetical protein